MGAVEVDDETGNPSEPDQVPRPEVAMADHLRSAGEIDPGNRVVVAAKQRARSGQLAVAPGEPAGIRERLTLEEGQDVAPLLVEPEPTRRRIESHAVEMDEHI